MKIDSAMLFGRPSTAPLRSRDHHLAPAQLKQIPLYLALAFTPAAFAEETIHTPQVNVTEEQFQPLPTLSDAEMKQDELQRRRAHSSDAAALLDGQPGISLYGAGGVSSLPVIHGLADDRLRIKVDGMDLISACANHMNPPLSYIAPTNVSSIKLYGGIVPVSLGGDSIGGTILVESSGPVFAKPGEGTLFQGQAGTFYRSNNNARGVDLSATLSGEKLSVSYSGSYVEANNYEAADNFKPAGIAASSVDIPGSARGWLDGDEVGSSYFKSQNHALDFALHHDNHLLELKLSAQDIPEQGFPNQRMDMTDNESRQFNLSYKGQYGWGNLKARAYHERTEHKMNFGEDKLYWYDGNMMVGMAAPVAGMPMETEGRNSGLVISGDIVLSERDLLRVGSEVQRYGLDDWWDPVANSMMMGPETFWNINDGERDRYAAFAEWEARWSTHWVSQLGLRHETVKMDTGLVQGYNSMGGMMGYGDPSNPASIPGAFNAADRSQTDLNLDLTALARYTPNASSSFEGGYAMKTRSPNLYERYAWSYNNAMVMNMNNWYGDGNGYVGNLGLDPETAHTLSLTGSWHDADGQHWGLTMTPYLTHVDDYIDAVICSELGKCPRNMMGQEIVTRVDGFRNLTLDNQHARLYGVDISGHATLVKGSDFGSLRASGVLSYVRGRNTDTDDDLYNIMPLNLKLGFHHRLGGWSNTLEMKLVDAKNHVQEVRKELKTAGYGLFNFYSSYAWKRARLDVGIENLFDKDYDLPLGGAYLGQGATMGTDVSWGTAVPGMGRSLNTSVTFNF
jgi:iron complex outermembrane receptor protein